MSDQPRRSRRALSRRSRRARRPRARSRRRGRRASRPAARPGRASSSGRAAGRGSPAGNGASGSSLPSRSSSSVSDDDHRQRPAQLRADREALEVPGDVLAEVADALALGAQPLDEQLGVPAHHRGHLAQRRRGGASGRPANAAARSANSHGRPRQPRPTTTPSQPVSRDHPQRVVGRPDVAVAEHRDVQRLLQRGDRVPVGRAGVVLRRRSGRAGRPRRRRRPARSGRPRGRSGGRRRCPCAS